MLSMGWWGEEGGKCPPHYRWKALATVDASVLARRLSVCCSSCGGEELMLER